jgi:general secretion pathway protein B
MRPEDGSSAENAPAQEPTVIVRDNVPRVDQLPASTLSRLPPMVFAAHMYSSNEADRWVRVNNRRLSEGDNIDSNVQIVTIEPQHVVLSFQGIKFRMNALSDW